MYEVVLRRKRKRFSYESIHVLGDCETSEDAVSAARVWIRIAYAQGLWGYGTAIADAYHNLIAEESSAGVGGDVNWDWERFVPPPECNLFVRDESGSLFSIVY